MYPNVQVTVTYQGNRLTKRYYDCHPEIHYLYPTPYEFIQLYYMPLVEKAEETGQPQEIIITEGRICINGVCEDYSAVR